MTVILGPVPCQRCRRPVTWNGLEWQDSRGYLHKCAAQALRARARERWDNTGVGISDASSDNMCDALLVADTSREGVPRLEVSAPMTFDVR